MNESHAISTFQLDTYFVAPDTADPRVIEHVATCPACATYLAELAGMMDAPAPRPARSAPALRWRRAARFAAPLALAAGFVAYMAVGARTTVDPWDENHYVGVKGVPATQLLIRTAGTTRLWQGDGSITARDVLAFQVACEELAHVAVAAESEGVLTRFWDGACPQPALSVLPFTLVVDEQPGSEHFGVVLSRAPLGDADLQRALREQARTDSVWTTPFDLPKRP